MAWHLNDISQNNLTKSALWNKMLGKPYFEGWYHKLTCPETKTFFLVIFGYIANNKNKFAFIQVASAVDGKQHFFRFPIDDLIITKKRVQIGENYFTKKQLFMNLPNIQMECELASHLNRSEQTSFIGLKKFVPFVDCKHEVLCSDQILRGTIIYQNQVFHGAFTYYAETSWGQDFPDHYFWLHANCFENCANTSILIAQAEPKFLGWKTKQHLGYLKHDGKTHVFRTGNTRIKSEAETKSIELENKSVLVKIHYKNGIPVTLKGPFNGNMENNVVEHIKAPTSIYIQEHTGKETVLFTNLATWEMR